MDKREETSNNVDLNFDKIVQLDETAKDTIDENNIETTSEIDAFPFEGDAIESQEEIQKEDSDIFEIPVTENKTDEVSEPVMEAIDLGNGLEEIKEATPDVIFETTMPDFNIDLLSEEESSDDTLTKEEETIEEPEILEENDDILEEESLSEDTVEYDETNDLDLNDNIAELIDFESIMKELSDDIVGANNVATEINEKREYLKKAETEFLEQKEEFEQEKEKFKKTVTEENESIELKKAECDEYIKTQKKHMEEAEAQFKATVQTKEKEFDDLKKKLEEERKKLNQEKMDFAVEKASAEERIRSEREEIQKENEYLTNSSNKLKKLIEQFNSVSKQITD